MPTVPRVALAVFMIENVLTKDLRGEQEGAGLVERTDKDVLIRTNQ